MKETTKIELLGLLKVLNNVEEFRFKKGTKAVSPARMLGRILSETGTTMAKRVARLYPELVDESAPAAKTPAKAPAAPAEQAVLVKVLLGPYSNKLVANQEAAMFLKPNVFILRSTLFPSPGNFKVKPMALKAEVVRLDKPKNPLYTEAIELTVKVEGEPKNVADWIQAFRSRAATMLIH